MVALNLQVAASVDDTEVYVNGGVYTRSVTIDWMQAGNLGGGSISRHYFRFPITIPKGSIINTATLQQCIYESKNTDTYIGLLDLDTCPAFNTVAGATIWGYALSGALIFWNNNVVLNLIFSYVLINQLPKLHLPLNSKLRLLQKERKLILIHIGL